MGNIGCSDIVDEKFRNKSYERSVMIRKESQRQPTGTGVERVYCKLRQSQGYNISVLCDYERTAHESKDARHPKAMEEDCEQSSTVKMRVHQA